MAWVRACSEGDLEPGDALAIDTDPPVALFNVDGEFLATDDVCTHGQSSLAEGYVDGDIIECAWHFAKFSLRTGEVLSPPATMAISTYPTKVEDGAVYVEV